MSCLVEEGGEQSQMGRIGRMEVLGVVLDGDQPEVVVSPLDRLDAPVLGPCRRDELSDRAARPPGGGRC